MALTKISGSILKDPLNLGEVSIGGTLTYQDVTNVDSLGIGTFRTGINVSGGQLDVGSNIKIGTAGVVTATRFVGSVGTFTGDTSISGDLQVADIIKHAGDVNTKIRFPANDTFSVETAGTQRLLINASGQLIVTGDGHTNSSYGIFQVNQAADNDESGIAILNDANNRSMRLYVDASANSVINSGDGGSATLILNEGDGTVIVGNDLLPDADNDQDLGSSSKRWANIYTADLQLSNKGNTNDVDGTWGQYVIQEGEDDLFLINKRNGKKYKFMLEEVN